MIAPFSQCRLFAAYFPEANVPAAIESVADISNTPGSKSIVVSFAPAAQP
jgi:hypothetical protein